MNAPRPIDMSAVVDSLDFLPDRTPSTGETEASWAATVADYRDGGIFAVHYAGQSEWERHRGGDEIVMVIEGATTMTMLIDDQEHQQALGSMQMIVVPQGVWHRFDTPSGVKVMSVTPQPSDHQVERPSDT